MAERRGTKGKRNGRRERTVRLGDVATFITSRGAGPFLLTIDMIFPSRQTYERILRANAVTPETVARAYRVPPERVVDVIPFPPANAIKATLKRWRGAGALGEADYYAAEQHLPLMEMRVRI
jgi:hypothetical protein